MHKRQSCNTSLFSGNVCIHLHPHDGHDHLYFFLNVEEKDTPGPSSAWAGGCVGDLFYSGCVLS